LLLWIGGLQYKKYVTRAIARDEMGYVIGYRMDKMAWDGMEYGKGWM